MHRIYWQPSPGTQPPGTSATPVTWWVGDGWIDLHQEPAEALGAKALVLLGRCALAVGETCRSVKPAQAWKSASGTLVWSPPPLAHNDGESTRAQAPAAKRRPLHLIWNGRALPRASGITLVGRDPRCHLQIDDDRVSAFHCALAWDEGGLRLVDLKSRNGVFLGGQRVHAAVVERPALIQVGPATLRLEPQEEAPLARLPSPAMRSVYRWIDRVAPTCATVLIQGESGTGKEGIAREVHHRSGRSGPFVALNAATLTPSLAGSELFGHLRGAFTGAHEDRVGAFVHADGGTLFLDEIGELSLEVQADLLRVLEERAVRPLGALESQSVDVRLITATHRDLAAMMREGRFREDLFHRIYVLPVRLPPLRERPEDVDPLLEFFLARQGSPKQLSAAARRAARSYPWPGNIRELRNALERGCLLSPQDSIGPEHMGLPAADLTPRSHHILSVFDAHAGDVDATARTLGMHRSTVYRHLKRAGVRDVKDVSRVMEGLP